MLDVSVACFCLDCVGGWVRIVWVLFFVVCFLLSVGSVYFVGGITAVCFGLSVCSILLV